MFVCCLFVCLLAEWTGDVRTSLAWEILLDKSSMSAADESTRVHDRLAYKGWLHFPARIASSISSRQRQLKTRVDRRREAAKIVHSIQPIIATVAPEAAPVPEPADCSANSACSANAAAQVDSAPAPRGIRSSNKTTKEALNYQLCTGNRSAAGKRQLTARLANCDCLSGDTLPGEGHQSQRRLRPASTPSANCNCVHHTILNCLLPDVFHKTLDNLEAIRIHLKAVQMKRRKK